MKNKSLRKGNRDAYNTLVIVAATAGVIFLSAAVVLIVRAYLTAKTNQKLNEFAPMTYTNTEIVESTDRYTFSSEEISSNSETGPYRVVISKPASVKNLSGADKKPVFVRVAVRYSTYQLIKNGVNSDYLLNVTPDYPLTISYTPGSNWIDINDGYLYYKYIVNPGDETDNIFANDAVTLVMTKAPTTDLTFEVDIAADTVQAVATDSSKWTSSDYEKDDAIAAWGGLPSGVLKQTKS